MGDREVGGSLGTHYIHALSDFFTINSKGRTLGTIYIKGFNRMDVQCFEFVIQKRIGRNLLKKN